MVKQTKRFKKGGMAKKVLSAILAASMVMTSSCLAFAAPVEEPVAVVEEDAATVGEAAPVEEESATEDLQGRAAATSVTVTAGNVTFNGKEQHPKLTVKGTIGGQVTTAVENVDYFVEWPAESVNAGEYEYTITFDNKFAGTAPQTGTYTIAKANLASATVAFEDANVFVYNGKEQHPQSVSVKVKLGTGADAYEYTLSEDEYEITFAGGKKSIEAGSYNCVVAAKEDSNFAGSKTGVSYRIDKGTMTDELVSVSAKDIVYKNNLTETDVKAAVTVKDINLDKVLGTNEYTVEVDDKSTMMNIGPHTFTVKPAAAAKNYAGGEIKGEYMVVAENSLASVVAGIEESYTYADKTDRYEAALKYVKAELTKLGLAENVDYKFVTEKAEWINAGEYAFEIVGLNKYADQKASIPVVIAPKELTVNAITATQSTHPGSGNLSEVAVVVKDGVKVLTEGVDYTYTVETKEDGTSKVLVTGIGNYTTGEKALEKAVTLTKGRLNLADSSISAVVKTPSFEYTGKEITLKASDLLIIETDGSEEITLQPNVDYYIDETSYKNNKEPGTATFTVKGMGKGYTGSLTMEFEITGVSFSDNYTATLKQDTFEENVAATTVKNAVVVKANGSTGATTKVKTTILKDDKEVTDATLKAGVYTLRVEHSNAAYDGYIDLTFTVTGKDVSKDVTVAAIEDQDYTGKAVEPGVTVTYNKTELKAGEDYDVAYEDNINVGVAKAVITLKGDYSGTLVRTFKINKVAQTVTLDPRQAGKNGLLNRTTGDKDCTMRLTLGVEDKLAKYTFESSNPEVAKVSAKGVISYQSVGTATIKITVTSPNTEDAVLEQTVNVTKLGKASFTPTVTSRTPAKGFTVTSNTVKGAEGWQVRFSRYENMKSATTKSFYGVGKKLSRQTLTAMWPNMKYYVQVRPYYTNADGEKVFSDWSAAKTIVSAATK